MVGAVGLEPTTSRAEGEVSLNLYCSRGAPTPTCTVLSRLRSAGVAVYALGAIKALWLIADDQRLVDSTEPPLRLARSSSGYKPDASLPTLQGHEQSRHPELHRALTNTNRARR